MRHWPAAALGAAIVVAGCGVEYRPGSSPADSTATTPAGATALAAPAVVQPVGTIDSLHGIGDPLPDSVALAPSATPLRTLPRTAADSAPVVGSADIDALRRRALVVPVSGVRAGDLRDSFEERRGGGTRPHEALDIMAARGTPVVAADAGRIVKLFTSQAGGLTIYAVSGDERYMLYYAHLDHYRDGLAEGQTVHKGEVIAYVGSTGDAAPDGPHLHFAIERVANPAWWWMGTPINPYLVLR
jgi:murein DD-endopeptidase MepM/ murein hydrolase activator NlpD